MITSKTKNCQERPYQKSRLPNNWPVFRKRIPIFKVICRRFRRAGYTGSDADEQKKYLNAWETYTQTDKTVVKLFRRRAQQAICLRIYLNSSERNTMLPDQRFENILRENREVCFLR